MGREGEGEEGKWVEEGGGEEKWAEKGGWGKGGWGDHVLEDECLMACAVRMARQWRQTHL